MASIINQDGPSNLTGGAEFDNFSTDLAGYANLGANDDDRITTGSGGGSVALTLGNDTLIGRGSDIVAMTNLRVLTVPDENGMTELLFISVDSLSINLATGSYTATWRNVAENLTLTGNGSVQGFSDVFATNGNDTLTGSNFDGQNPRLSNVFGEIFDGRAGDDVIFGGGGRDTLILRVDQDTSVPVVGGAIVDAGAGTARDPNGGNDRFSGIESFRLSGLNDSFQGGDLAVTVFGSQGNDTILGGSSGGTVDYARAGLGGALLVNGTQVTKNGGSVDTVEGMVILGTFLADTMNGSAGRDQWLGSFGNDTMRGLGGDDALIGGAGNDSIDGGDGTDLINGDDETDAGGTAGGNDVLRGNDGDDIIFGAGGLDTIFGGAGNDAVSGSLGEDVLNGDDGNDAMVGGDGADTLSGGAGNDELGGGAADDSLVGGSGVDSLLGNDGNDALFGGTNDDLLIGQDGDDTLSGGDADDQVFGGNGHDMQAGNAGDDLAFGEEGNDTIEGGAGSDTLQGDDGNDRLQGGEDVDALYGGLGSDRLSGDAGNDVLTPDQGRDTLDGGDGADLLHLGIATVAGGGDAVVDLAAGTLRSSVWGSDRLISIENVAGSSLNDRIAGDGNTNLLSGQDGNDTLLGADGNDVLLGGRGADEVRGGSGDDSIQGDGANASGNSNDRLYGDAGNDLIFGGLGIDRMFGGGGLDILEAGSGNDQLTGGGDADIFVASLGSDDVLDFVPGLDRIDLTGDAVRFTFATLADIEARVVNANAASMVLRISGTSTITLTGIGFDDIGLIDFIL